MDVVLKYRGRVIREADVAVIRALIQEHATASRRELSQQLCKVWNCVQPNGALRGVRHDTPGIDAGAGTRGAYRAAAGKVETG